MIYCDGVHNVQCHQWHWRGSLLLYYYHIVQYDTCRNDLAGPVWRDPQASKATEPALDDPQGHLYPDPGFRKCRIEAPLWHCFRVRIGGHQVLVSLVVSVSPQEVCQSGLLIKGEEITGSVPQFNKKYNQLCIFATPCSNSNDSQKMQES